MLCKRNTARILLIDRSCMQLINTSSMNSLRAYRTSAAHMANACNSASVVDVATIDPKQDRQEKTALLTKRK